MLADVEEAQYVSTVCEVFTIPPVAGGAVDQPIRLTRAILWLRQYRTACDLVDGNVPVGPDGPPGWAEALIQEVQSARLALVGLG